MSKSELDRLIIRRDRDEAGVSAQFPERARTKWIYGSDRPEIVDAIRALPPPLPLREAGEARELIARGLVRQWASSEHALAAALKRRLLSAAAMESSLESGRYPSRSDIKSWLFSDEVVQLGFAELLSPIAEIGVSDLLFAVRRHAAGLRSLLELLGHSLSMDLELATQISRIRRCHSDSRIVAFSAYAATVRALFDLLSRERGVALLTSAGGRVAGGKISRAEILAQFSPESRQRHFPEAIKIELLLTTDLLSEGVNLQDASVAIHLDLPWTHARIEQRNGRIARLGSRHRAVAIYGFKPPKSADDFLKGSAVVRRKFQDSTNVAAQPATHERIRATLARWIGTQPAPSTGVPLVASVQSRARGFLATVITVGKPQLLCGHAGAATDRTACVAHACENAEGSSAPVLHDEAIEALTTITAWLERQLGAASAGLGTQSHLESRRRLIAGIDSVASRSPPARRSRMLQLITAARQAATNTLGASAEAELSTLASAEMKNEDWLRQIVQLGGAVRKRAADPGSSIVALLLLTRSPAS